MRGQPRFGLLSFTCANLYLPMRLSASQPLETPCGSQPHQACVVAECIYARWRAAEPPHRSDGRGRPWREARGAERHAVDHAHRCGVAGLAGSLPPYQTCHRRFQQWTRDGTFERILVVWVTDLYERGGLDLSECFIDGTFVIAKKGGMGVGKPKRGKGTKIMVIADRAGPPVSVHVASATPHEVTLVRATVEAICCPAQPERLIGDKAYGRDGLDAELAAQGIELIAPHRANRTKFATPDGRALRRNGRRWTMERSNSWLRNFPRVVVRYVRYVENFLSSVQRACSIILLRPLFRYL